MFASLIFVFTVSSLTSAESIDSLPRYQEANYCLLPPYPDHGRYTVSNYLYGKPGDRYASVKLDINCDTGYLSNNTTESIFCVNGDWSAPMPTCVRDLLGICTLSTNDLRVEYRCVSAPESLKSSQECESYVPSGAVVTPICRSPAYFSLRELSKMHCRNGMWDYNPICNRACGMITQHRQLEGTSSNHLELPWHASVYRKSVIPYLDRCGGSLITATKVISAAYCFYNFNGWLLPASNFVVSLNQMYLNYNDARDRNSQHSDVADILAPSSYQGNATNYENDIAIVVVKTPFFFHLSVRPVCLDFDNILDSTQLTEGNSGKAVHWSAPVNNDRSSQVLKVVELPYMKLEDCYNVLPSKYRPFLTKDKFCAIYNNETGSYSIAPGSGLAFLESTVQRY